MHKKKEETKRVDEQTKVTVEVLCDPNSQPDDTVVCSGFHDKFFFNWDYVN